jgi:hypothetical protein
LNLLVNFKQLQTFDDVIEKMVRDGVLTQEGAMPYATNPGNLLLRLGDLGGKAPVPKTHASFKKESSMLDMIEK